MHDSIENAVNYKIYTPEESESMTKKEESQDKMNSTNFVNDAKNHQSFRWLTDNREQRTRPWDHVEVLQSGYEKKWTFAVSFSIQDASVVINSATKKMYTVGNITTHL